MKDEAQTLADLLQRTAVEPQRGIDFDAVAERVHRRRSVVWLAGSAAVVAVAVAGTATLSNAGENASDRAPAASATASPSPQETNAPMRITISTHCGVVSATVDGHLWLADPPLGDHNPPPGWDENEASGTFATTGPETAIFTTDAGQQAKFRLAEPGAPDPNAECE